MQTTVLSAPDISCDHCKMTIEREVGSLRGVQSCSVDIPTQQVTVTYDPDHTSRDRIVETLDEEGYPVTE